MSSSIIPIYHFFFFFLLFILSSFVRADEILIHKECHNTDNPQLCERCLHSVPGSFKANRVGIAVNVVHCLSSHAKVLQANMSNLAKHASDKNLRDAYRTCRNGYGEAVSKDLVKTVSSLKKGDFDVANLSIGTAVGHQISCVNSLEEFQVELEPNVLYQINCLQDLAEGAMRIIDRF